MVAQVQNAGEINMNFRMGLKKLVTELKRRKESMVDVVADARQMLCEVEDGRLIMKAKPGTPLTEWLPTEGAGLQAQAVGQFLSRLNVSPDKRFADKLTAAHPDIAQDLFNSLLSRTPERQLVRLMDGNVRAILSNRYRVLDHYDIALQALNIAEEFDCRVIECHLTDRRMAIKFVSLAMFDAIDTAQKQDGGYGGIGNHEWIGRTGGMNRWPQTDLPGGPGTVHPLVTITNSETGDGGLSIKTGLLQAVCLNSAILSTELSQVHIGGALGEGIMSEATRAADAKAIYMKAGDSLKAAFNPERFTAAVAKAKGLKEIKIANPRAAVDAVVNSGWVNAEAADAILDRWLSDYDRDGYGLVEALSRVGQDYEDADVGAQFEVAAGSVMERPEMLVQAV
jgi:hypothetical protein